MFRRILIVALVGLFAETVFSQDRPEKTKNNFELRSEPQTKTGFNFLSFPLDGFGDIGLRLGLEAGCGIEIGSPIIELVKNFPEFMRFIPIHDDDKSKVPPENNGIIPDHEIKGPAGDLFSPFHIGLNFRLNLNHFVLSFKEKISYYPAYISDFCAGCDAIRERIYMSNIDTIRAEHCYMTTPNTPGCDPNKEYWRAVDAMTYYGIHYRRIRPFYFNIELGFETGDREEGATYVLGYSETQNEIVLEQGWKRCGVKKYHISESPYKLEAYKSFILEKFRWRKFYIGAYLYGFPEKHGTGLKYFLNIGISQAKKQKTVNKVSVVYSKYAVFFQIGLTVYPSIKIF